MCRRAPRWWKSRRPRRMELGEGVQGLSKEMLRRTILDKFELLHEAESDWLAFGSMFFAPRLCSSRS